MPRFITRMSTQVLLLTSLLAGGPSCKTAPMPIHENLIQERTSPAEWTIMVFLNGDNNLEPFALSDFREMARVGSTDNVNVVVQFDRNGKYDQSAVQWTQTLRFRVTAGMNGTPQEALADLGETNMGDGKTLQNFVEWAVDKFPARRYGLVIWDHGQGWRAAPPAGTSSVASTAVAGPFRAASHDESSNDQLYNAEMVAALTKALKGKKLDLLGFDACLMTMLETGYAFRGLAEAMVGSEELEPGDGWNYAKWLRPLVDKPQMAAEELATHIVDAYADHYRAGMFADPNTTQSAIRLAPIEQAADAVDVLAKTLEKHLPTELALIRAARNATKVYAPNTFNDGRDAFQHLDLVKFCDELLARTGSPANPAQAEIRAQAEAARAAVLKTVIRSYAGRNRQGAFGSNGLAIYFPGSGTLYKNDLFAENGYERNNTKYPVEFVQKNAWTDFLHAYFKRVP